MPTILLINDNKIVSRLLQLSSQKHNYTLEEINDYTASKDAYNVIFIDSDKYDAEALEALKNTLTYDKLGFIGDKTVTKPEGFDLSLEKPFLPTDFVALMDQNFKVMSPEELSASELDEIEEIEGEETLDLDDLEEIDLDGELESASLDDLDSLEVDLEDVSEDVSVKSGASETMLTTGIAAATMGEDESKEELAGIVDEIENMEDIAPLEEMDLDSLEEENPTDTIVDETLVKESLDEVQEQMDEEVQEQEIAQEVAESNSLDDSEEVINEEIEEEIAIAEENIAEKEEVTESDTTTVAAGIAAASVAAVGGLISSESETDDESLNILDGVESIESEEDYLKESGHDIEELADEFDSLNEAEVAQIMSGESAEEIISEEITTDGEEKVVESSDLEEMITRAVAKAITKEMLQEALHDMEISISLKTKKES